MIFHYKAKDFQGAVKEGDIEAKNIQEIYTVLKKKGLFALSVKEKGGKLNLNLPFLNKISLKDVAIFTKQLEIMIRAGLSLVKALEALGEQTENKKLAKISTKLSEDVKGGSAFSEALSKHPSAFSSLYLGTVKSGEKSGTLEESLSSLAAQLENDYELQSKIRGAMIYPAFILLALLATVILLFIYVIPALTKLFSELGGQLPITTRILISSSNLITKFWWLIILILIGLFLALYFYQKTERGKEITDALKLKIPIFGNLIKKIYLARFARTSSTLIRSGLPLTEVLKTTKVVIDNAVFQKHIENIHKKVEGGVTLSQALKDSKIFPGIIYNLVSAGELSGNLKESFETAANFYEKEITRITATLSSLIEPILIVVIGIGVAIAVVSIIKPIYSVTEML